MGSNLLIFIAYAVIGYGVGSALLIGLAILGYYYSG